ncbi:MAG: TonB-dependent receptor [Tannerellaceae bacterium]|jgi:TonB-linked SusC/RagA family outer membrane protein|nr:TonB-dependent receptor [Tannerellaceae bacterium]
MKNVVLVRGKSRKSLSIKVCLFVAAALLCWCGDMPEALAQQSIRVSGKVTDAGGLEIIGASVMEIGTTNGAITNAAGEFSLNVQSGRMLRISYVGYVTKELRAAARMDVVLEEDQQSLEEVVVIGYGTVKKKDLTGAVASMGGSDLASRKTTQVSTALQGAIPGVMVTRDNNAPGASATVRVRGITTIGNTDPLIIVDGMQVGNINDVNPNDIETMSVLKDAASASIYGSQAAAGVILITTKRAPTDRFNLEYNFEYGLEIPTQRPAYAEAVRFMQMTNELRWNDAGNGANEYPTYAKDVIDNYYQLNKENPNKYPITNWQDLMFRSNAPRQSHIIRISGGSKNLRSSASIAYDNIGAIYEGRTYERITSRLNNDLRINKYLSASLDVNLKRTIDKQPSMNPVYYARISAPVYAPTWADGRMAEGKTGANIYGQIKEGGYNNNYYNQLGARAAIDITPIEGLKISGIIAPVFNFSKTKQWRTAVPWYTADDPTVLGGYMQWGQTTNLRESRNDNYQVTTQFLVNYEKSFGDHSLNLMGGYEDRYEFNEDLGAFRDKYELDSYPYLNIGPLELRDNSGSAYEYARQSFFGRVIYDFQRKYLLQANLRYDASSRFAKDYRWGAFPSVSLGWVLTEEGFLRDNQLLQFLKLRASWGTLGNERIGNYPYQATMAFSNALFFQNGNVVSLQGAAQPRYAIRDISWETTESYNIGVDAYLLDSRLRFSGEYYRKMTKDMLLALQIPSYMGFDNPDQNTGKMHTTGWEIDLGWSDRIGDLGYSVSFNVADFRSIMGDLGGTEFLGDKIKIEGSEFDEWYGYRSQGIFQTADEVANSAVINASTKPGDLKYQDIDGANGEPDNRISPEYDRVLLGGSLPRYTYGGNIKLDYKNFDLGITIQGVGKQNVRVAELMVRPLMENWGNVPAIIDGKYYSNYNTAEQNLAAEYPRLTYSNASNYTTMSDFWMFNGRYFRLKNVGLGYSVPKSILSALTLQQLRLYVSASDLFCISRYPTGWDPENGTSAYPITTSVLFGVSVQF